jgi:hypothetical protein
VIKIYTSARVDMGTAAYYAARTAAERVAQDERAAGRSANVRWDDEYNDNSARGVFVVTGRA